MKKTWIIVIAVVAVLVIYCVSSYNSLVTQEETVGTAWSNVENQYQRRSDLIPNLSIPLRDMPHTKKKHSMRWYQPEQKLLR